MTISGEAADPALLVPDDDVALGRLDTPVGALTVAVSRVGLCAVGWGVGAAAARGRPVLQDARRTAPALAQLDAYFHGELEEFDLQLDLRAVRRSPLLVLQALYDTVPYGRSVTYGSWRTAVGQECRPGDRLDHGCQPDPHRGAVSPGAVAERARRIQRRPFGEGIQTKRWLLTMEGVLQPTLDWPGGR